MKNDFSDWFDGDFEKLNVVATYNLIYNASVLVKEALGYAICLDKLINLDEKSELCFKPFSPKLESNLDVVWKKSLIFSPLQKLFLDKLRSKLKTI